jgi:hypothetical protein
MHPPEVPQGLEYNNIIYDLLDDIPKMLANGGNDPLLANSMLDKMRLFSNFSLQKIIHFSPPSSKLPLWRGFKLGWARLNNQSTSHQASTFFTIILPL